MHPFVLFLYYYNKVCLFLAVDIEKNGIISIINTIVGKVFCYINLIVFIYNEISVFSITILLVSHKKYQ